MEYIKSSLGVVEQHSVPSYDLNREITRDELELGIKRLKINKACGTDSVTNEMIIHGGHQLYATILILFNRILDSGTYPAEWNTNIIVPIHKSGLKSDPSNYRGISLSSCMSKLFITILNSRIEAFLTENDLIAMNQNGFKRGHRTEDNVMILRSLFNKYVTTSNQKLYVAFIDFKKFFDLIDRDILCYKMQQIGITGNVYSLIKSMYTSCLYKINCGQGLSEAILSTIGLKQGCPFSPNLSNTVQNDIHSIFDNICDPVDLDGTQFNSLSWADDLVLISTSPKGLQNALDALSSYCNKWSICINPTKSVSMVLSKRKTTLKQPMSLNGSHLEYAHHVTYLGFYLTYNLDSKAMIEDRITKANRAAYVLRQGLSVAGTNNVIDIKLAMSLFDKLVAPILLYGCPIWAMANSTNLIYLQNIQEGENTRTLAISELSKCGKQIEINYARRVGRPSDNHNRDILIDLKHYDDKTLLLYSNTDMSLKQKLRKYDVSLHMYDSLCEKVHTRFLKSVLSVSKFTSNMAVFGDLGRLPITIKSLAIGVKYWQKIAAGASPNKLLSLAYNTECQHLQSSPWLQNIQCLLTENGLGEYWINPNNYSIYNIFRKRLNDQFIQNWFEKANSGISLHTLGILKDRYSYSNYLSEVKSINIRRIITKLRLNYGMLNYSRLHDADARLCKMCDMSVEEDISHFLCVCPVYTDARRDLMRNIAGSQPSFSGLPQETQIKILLNLDFSTIRLSNNMSEHELTGHIASYLKRIVKIRSAMDNSTGSPDPLAT